MFKQKSLKFNFIMNVILTLSGFIFPLISYPYVSRILLPEGMGKVAMALSVVAYFTLLASLGIPMYGIRACAGLRDNRLALSKLVHELFFINFCMGIISYIIFFICLFSIDKLKVEFSLYLIVCTIIFFDILGVEWLYKALEEYTYITIRSILFKFIAVIAMFVLIHEQKDYVVYGGISIFAASASNLLNFYNLRKYITFSVFKNYNFRQHMKPIAVFFATSCAIIIYTQLNTIMLGFIKTNSDVGLYDSAMKIKNILGTVVSALGAVLLPRTSYYIQNKKYDEFKKITFKATHFVSLISIPLICFFMLFAQNSILFLSGRNYMGAVLPLQIVLPSIFFMGLTNIIGTQVLVPLGQEKAVLYSVITGGIIDLFCCIIFIPALGAVGAAISNLVAEFAVLITQVLLVRPFKDLFNINGAMQEVSFVKIIISICLAISLSFFIKKFPIGNFGILAFAGIIFFAIYFFALYFFKESIIIEYSKQVKDRLGFCIDHRLSK